MVVADGYLFDEHERYAQNIVCGFARVGGRFVGILSNQLVLLEEDSPYAAAVTWCDS
jgi:acetyl-CoA carboxylase carboxyltransferase component